MGVTPAYQRSASGLQEALAATDQGCQVSCWPGYPGSFPSQNGITSRPAEQAHQPEVFTEACLQPTGRPDSFWINF